MKKLVGSAAIAMGLTIAGSVVSAEAANPTSPPAEAVDPPPAEALDEIEADPSDNPPVAAPTAAHDDVVVRLKDGTVVRGKLVEWIPRKQLVLLLPNGEGRIYPADRIVDPGRFHVDPCAPQSYAPIESPDAPVVVLRGRGKSVIERRQNAHGWGDVCIEPCYQRLDPRFLYRVSSRSGGRPTEPFRLPVSGSQTEIEASFKPQTMATTGAIFAVGGAYFLMAGGASYGIGKAVGSDYSSGRFLQKSGTVEVLLGAGFLALGLPLYLLSTPTSTVRSITRGSGYPGKNN